MLPACDESANRVRNELYRDRGQQESGDGGITLLARIAGLLLAAIAVQLIADSVRGFIAGG